MGRVRWQERIVIAQGPAPHAVCGDPCIKGTRIPVAMIVASLPNAATRMLRDLAHDALSVKEQAMAGGFYG
jgi:uncharacterized protein (DUF433 family)